MRWQQSRRSGNVVDVRRGRGGRAAGLGIGGLIIVLIGLLFGVDTSGIAALLGEGGAPVPAETSAPPQDEAGDFVAAVLGDTEDVWHRLFREAGATYPEPRLVLFDGTVRSACGMASAATGPFYCPADQQLYLDLSFFRELARMGAPGEFAAAYVIAHEVGHHVQNVEGTLAAVQRAQRQLPRSDANALSVRTELQADCYAGVWGYHARQRGLLEPGDVEAGMRAAAAVGDDRLQQAAGRVATPETFTHGSSAQRVAAFRTGLESGRPAACDTFGDLRR